jgi:hypothetical protein
MFKTARFLKTSIATNQWRLLISLFQPRLGNENLAKQSSIEKLQLAKSEASLSKLSELGCRIATRL